MYIQKRELLRKPATKLDKTSKIEKNNSGTAHKAPGFPDKSKNHIRLTNRNIHFNPMHTLPNKPPEPIANKPCTC